MVRYRTALASCVSVLGKRGTIIGVRLASFDQKDPSPFVPGRTNFARGKRNGASQAQSHKIYAHPNSINFIAKQFLRHGADVETFDLFGLPPRRVRDTILDRAKCVSLA